VKGAPIPANNPTIRNLEARRDKINQVRNTAK
jgi:hypothetical protein